MNERTYTIEDDGEAFQLSLFANGQQVGNALFPDIGDGEAFALARDLGEAWKRGPQ